MLYHQTPNWQSVVCKLLFDSTSSVGILIPQTFKKDELIHNDSCLTHQLAYVRVMVIYISLSEYETIMATLP